MKKSFWTILFVLLTILANAIEPTPVASAGEWYAEYYNNATLAGGPTLTRYESGLHFEWGNGSPGTGIPADNFSVRFTHDEWFDGGTYRFSYRSDDGMRLWVDDALIIDDWRDREATWSLVEHYIAPGTHHVRVEYYEHGGGAALAAALEKVSGGAAWRGDYYGNRDLSSNPALTRYDAAIDFDWGTGSPDAKVPVDNFSVRWTRTLGFEAGTYRFYASCDDGVRIIVDGRRVVDVWQNQKLPNTRSGDMALGAGQHTITVEYYEEGGDASAHVWWNRLDALKGWEGRYFDNRELRGGPALIRDDAEINFDWGQGTPADWIPSDNFSIQWIRQINFAPGLYRFNTRSDDGMRLWIDDTSLHMNYWQTQDYVWRYQDWHYLEGPHTLRLEYFEATGSARIQFWWDYAATVEAAQAMPPSPNYGFAQAPTPAAGTPPVSGSPAQPSPAQPGAPLPGPWQGEYFTGRDLTKTPTLVRTDAAIDFDWGWGSPAAEIPVNQFAARWTGTFTFEAASYRFTTTTDDGVRVYVDDHLILDSWRAMHGTRSATVNLTAGQHTVRVEYFEATQAAKARVTWVRSGSAPAPAITTTAAAEVVPGPWEVRYYDNANLAGTPVVVQTVDTALDFNWGLGSPSTSVPADNFSASWQRTMADLTPGRYTFTVTSDDGVRLYVNDTLVIQSWYAMRGSRTATVNLPGGNAVIRLEYFERSGAANVRLTWKKP